MRNHSPGLAGTAALLALFAGPAHADTGWEASGFVGAHIFSETNDLGAPDAPAENSIKNSVALGLRVLYGFTPMFGAELELAGVPSTAREGEASVFALGYRIHGTARFRSPTAKLRPFVVLGGAGMTSISSDQDVLKTATHFMPQAGVGLTYRIGKRWGLRADARLFLPPATEGSLTTDFEITAGAFYHFGTTEEIMDSIKQVTDLDGDGLFGDSDKCPEIPEDPDGFEDSDGCPEEDNDKDGLPDAQDRCPNEPETVNQFDDFDGCPDTVPKVVEEFQGTIQGINFKLNSAEILPSSFKVLNRAVAVLKEYPTLAIEIQGHTDNTGDPAYNLDLSARRAEAVKNYFVKQGIEESRLTAQGYGMTQPLADNATEEGRSKNRRVEFRRVATPAPAKKAEPELE